MADQAAPTGGTPRAEGQRDRGRGQNRGRGGNSRGGENRQSDGNYRGGGRGGRGGNRGGGNNVEQKRPEQPKQSQPQPTIERKDKDVEGKDGELDVEAEVCFICASPVVHNSVAPCNHRTCHICALRMRALYKTKECPHCRTAAPYVIFTDDATKRFEDFADAEDMPTDESIGIRYESEEIQMDTRILLRYNCPDGECDVACLSWPDLHKHVRAVHHKKICDLCSRHKKVFTHEHELLTDKELNQHLTKGDDNPGAVDQSGFKGHPLCGFCKKRFYGEDELYVHCRESHERCFICDRRPGAAVYYLNYDSLEEHFRLVHFLCPDQACLEKKFIVFPTEIDLKAHQLEEHGHTLSKDVRRDARMVDISGFDYRAPYVQERRGGGSQREQRGRGGTGRGMGRDPNAEPLPASSAQPLPRDQQAFQRQMAIHSAQSVSTRTFGGQLTPAAPARAQAHPGARDPQTVGVNPSARVEAATAAVRSLDLAQADLPPQDQARALRHRAVIERATILLQNDEPKLTQFRNLISSFKSSSITARSLIDSFFGLFSDTSSNALGTLIREVADLYEDKTKADGLRTAWNDWRAINEDYPSLPGPAISSTAFPGNWAVTTSATGSSNSTTTSTPKSTRVLKLKNSTAQSSRSSVSQTRSWGTASSLASSANPFPGLPPPSTSSTSAGQTMGRITTVPWVASSSSAPSSNPGSAPTSRPASTAPGRGRGGGPGTDNFPALPPAKKPQSTIFGYGTGMVRRDVGGGRGTNAWGQGGVENNNGNENNVEGAGDEGESEVGKGKKKGNKGKKQVLMNWG